MTIRRLDTNELRKAGRPGVSGADVPPAGISPVLRASWKFARDTAKRFSQELLQDRSASWLKRLVDKF